MNLKMFVSALTLAVLLSLAAHTIHSNLTLADGSDPMPLCRAPHCPQK